MYFPLCLSGQKTSNQLQCSTVLINLREEKFTICSRLNGAPSKRNVYVLSSDHVDVTLSEKRVFADGIKLMISRWDHLELLGCVCVGGALHPVTSVLLKDGRGGEDPCEDGLEWYGCQPRDSWKLEGARKDPPLEHEGMRPCGTLFWISGAHNRVRTYLYFHATKVVGFVMAARGN